MDYTFEEEEEEEEGRCVLLFYVIALYLNAFRPTIHKYLDCVRNKSFFVRCQAVLPPLYSLHHAHFRCNVINVDSSVVPDMLIDLLISLNTCYTQWPPRTLIIDTIPPCLESFHRIVNLSLAHTGIAIADCHSFVNCTSFQTLTIKPGSQIVILL
jgi:hypothetical protein